MAVLACLRVAPVRTTAAAAVVRPFPYPLAAGGLILVSVLLNLAYLVCDCPLDLAPDEAHYWHWSRHLDWSYYSKGPLVAWLIRASCELFGPLSVAIVGSEMLAVRLPAVVAQGVFLAGLYVLGTMVLREPRGGFLVVALALTLPPVAALGVIMTIDPPFLACWCWALVFAIRAITRDRLRDWVFAGLCSALGVLAKYPMLLLPVAVAGFLLRHRRAEFTRPGYWLFAGLTLLGCVPVVVWNITHDWVSVRHVLGQAGVGDGVRTMGFRWGGPPTFVLGQFGFLLGYWFVAFVAAAWAYRTKALWSRPVVVPVPSPSRNDRIAPICSERRGGPGLGVSDRGCANPSVAVAVLWWASVPVWAIFAIASLRTAGQVNWPAAAYVGGLVLAVAWVRQQLADPSPRYRGICRVCLGCAAVGGLGASVCLHYPSILRSVLVRFAAPATESQPAPIRKLDPTCRLRGWRTLAAEIDRLRNRVRAETGADPALAGMVWTTPGELAFYCEGHPEAYSFGLALADRHSQYDVWRPNPVADAQFFRGRTFLYVGDEIPHADEVFERVEPPIRVVHAEGGVTVAVWTIWVGHGFRGFANPRTGATRAGF